MGTIVPLHGALGYRMNWDAGGTRRTWNCDLSLDSDLGPGLGRPLTRGYRRAGPRRPPLDFLHSARSSVLLLSVPSPVSMPVPVAPAPAKHQPGVRLSWTDHGGQLAFAHRGDGGRRVVGFVGRALRSHGGLADRHCDSPPAGGKILLIIRNSARGK